VFGTSSQSFLGGDDGFTVLLSLVPIALLLAVARERLTTSPVEGIVSGIGVLVGSLVAVAVADVPYPTVFGG